MKRFIAFIFLFLFMFSTVGAFASVHQCKGEVTDISLLTLASCEHEEVVKEEATHCDMHCCDSDDQEKEDNDNQDNNDCCDTEELSKVESFMTSIVKAELQLVLIQLPTFVDFCLTTTPKEQLVLKGYLPPILSSDISLEIQRFLI